MCINQPLLSESTYQLNFNYLKLRSYLRLVILADVDNKFQCYVKAKVKVLTDTKHQNTRPDDLRLSRTTVH